MEINRKPLQASPRSPGADYQTVRRLSVMTQAKVYSEQLSGLTQESKVLRAEIYRRLAELRVIRMKQAILLAKTRLSCLEGSETLASLGGTERPRPSCEETRPANWNIRGKPTIQ
jgi:hypothetical protein